MVFECPANEATNYASNRMGHYGNTSCGFFKLESFSSKNQHTQKKLGGPVIIGGDNRPSPGWKGLT